MNKLLKKLSDKTYLKLKDNMPPISDTEKVAIESGNTWIESQIFQGKINHEEFKKIKNSILSEEEKKFIENELQGLFEIIDAKKIHEKKDLDEETWDYLKDNRFFAMIIPKEYGGLEFSSYANSTIVGMIASVNVEVAVTVMVPNSLGPGELLMNYGTEQQKNKWLKSLAIGEDIPCFALTSPDAGSDAGAIPDTGIVEKRVIDGQEVIGLKLNFNKRYITLAPKATLLGLAFKMYDPNNIIGEKKEYGITCALLSMDTDGVDNSNRHIPMNLSFMNGPLFGKDVFIPVDSIIGGVKNAGMGWKMLVECLSAGRGISLPALGVATTQSMYKGTSAYSYVRKQFGSAIGNFEGVEEGLIEIAGLNYINESLRKFTTTSLDLGNHPSVVTAITKYHSTEMARRTLQLSMDIHAGKAIIAGDDNYHINSYLGMPISITVEGANILTRNLMIFGQGSIRCHPYLLKEMDLLYSDDEVKAKEEFYGVLKDHIKYTSKNAIKSLINTFTLSLLSSSFGHKDLRSESKKISKLSKNLSYVSDMSLLVLGGKLKQKEYLSARLGDVLSYLYMALAVMKYYEENPTKSDLVHAKWSLNYLFNETGKAFDEFFDNFPNKIISSKMKLVTFTFGTKMKRMSHDDARAIIDIMHGSDLKFRDRLSEMCRIDAKDHPMQNVEDAFKATLDTLDLEKVIKSKMKEGLIEKNTLEEMSIKALEIEVITKKEHDLLIHAKALRDDAISVSHIKK
jgi:acyl-CoA dehydrogenase